MSVQKKEMPEQQGQQKGSFRCFQTMIFQRDAEPNMDPDNSDRRKAILKLRKEIEFR